MPLAGARRTTKPILGSLDTNSPAATRASRKRRESLHIADAGCWPDPLEAAVQKHEKQAQKLRQTQEDHAVEAEWRARLREVEEAAENGRRDAEVAAEAERRVTAETAAAAEAVVAEKAARVVAALEEADVQRAHEEADAAARQVAKKKAKQDAQERKARRLSAAAWAERPASQAMLWPCEVDLQVAASVPLPATPVQQRYEGRLSRARKVNSERRSVTMRSGALSALSCKPRALSPVLGAEEEAEVETAAEVKEGAAAAEEEVAAEAEAEAGGMEEEVEEEAAVVVAKEEVVVVAAGAAGAAPNSAQVPAEANSRTPAGGGGERPSSWQDWRPAGLDLPGLASNLGLDLAAWRETSSTPELASPMPPPPRLAGRPVNDRAALVSHARTTALGAAAWAVAGATIALSLRRARALNLHRGRTPVESSTRVLSLVHAAISSVWAARLLQARGGFCGPFTFVKRLEDSDATNTRAEDTLLRFSTSYWLADMLYLLAVERDPLFLAHHGVCLTIWPGSLFTGCGAMVPLLATALGEASTPLLNAWWLAKRAGAARLERPLSRAFTAAFVPLRSVLLPVYAYALARSALSGRLDRRLGAATARLWAVLLLAAVGGGVAWSRALLAGFLKANRLPRQLA